MRIAHLITTSKFVNQIFALLWTIDQDNRQFPLQANSPILNAMKTYRQCFHVLSFLLVLMSTGLAQTTTPQAPVMPQDCWRYDQLKFTGPNTTTTKRGIAIGTGGVYVGLGSPATAIQQFQENGTYVRQFGTFTAILGIACDSAGNVYVLDQGNSLISAFDKNGNSLRSWGGSGTGNGQFSNLASYGSMYYTTYVTVDRNDQIYVCDPGNSRVQVFDTQGNFLRKWGVQGSLPGQFGAGNPQGIVASPDGRIFAQSSTSTPPPLQVFDSQGNFLTSGTTINCYTPGAITPDGLLATLQYINGTYNGTYYNGVCGVCWWDANLAAGASPTGYSSSQVAIAFNSKGDLYGLDGANIFVCVREYSTVNNSPLQPAAIPQPIVLAVAQRNGTSYLDVDYKVIDADSATVTTAALAFLNGNNTLSDVVPMSTFMEGTGANIGAGQPSNTTRRITWNMAADWSVNFAQIQVEILANDGRNPLGIHWITVPTDGVNPAIQVSRKSVSDTDLLSLWYWYVATNKPGTVLSSGNLYGTTGIYNGLPLTYLIPGSTMMGATPATTGTTGAGRWFVYEQLGARPISSAEIARANAGRYGFVSVDQNSLVKVAAALSTVVLGWGDNSYNQTTIPFGALNATSIAAGSIHALALESDGTVVAWGGNYNGQCTVPSGLTGVTAIAAGCYDSHSLALKSDGTVVAWGSNSSGESTVPAGLTGVTAIAGNSGFSLALKSDGTVVSWGTNMNSGQATIPAGLSSVAAIAVGGSHCLALKSDGTVVAWGSNMSGQSTVPAGLTGVTAIAAGGSFSLALKNNGTVVAWGDNGYGQCTVPTGLTGVTAIAAGSSHSLALKSDKTVVAWGSNSSGQCTIPTGLSGVTAIAGGGNFTLVLKSN
jgi:hypothetical protein